MQPVAIVGTGMVTAVGLSAPATCAAIRCAIDHFVETRFIDKGGEWIIGSPVPLERPWRGLQKLVHMAVPAIRECLARTGSVTPSSIPLLVCVAERDRPGRIDGLESELFRRIVTELGVRFHPSSAVVPRGRVAGALAVEAARRLLYEARVPLCVIAGVDSLLVAATVTAYEERDRLLTSTNSNGFIPGEAAAAVLVGIPQVSGESQLTCFGIGFGREKATVDSEEPLRGDGMAHAIRNAMTDGECSLADTHYRLTDLNCEQYGFKEAVLAFNRMLRVRKEEHDIWHPADCIGEVGAAVGPCVLGLALAAAEKGYAPGAGVLCHFADDGETRAAMILKYTSQPGSSQA